MDVLAREWHWLAIGMFIIVAVTMIVLFVEQYRTDPNRKR